MGIKAKEDSTSSDINQRASCEHKQHNKTTNIFHCQANHNPSTNNYKHHNHHFNNDNNNNNHINKNNNDNNFNYDHNKNNHDHYNDNDNHVNNNSSYSCPCGSFPSSRHPFRLSEPIKWRRRPAIERSGPHLDRSQRTRTFPKAWSATHIVAFR